MPTELKASSILYLFQRLCAAYGLSADLKKEIGIEFAHMQELHKLFEGKK
jgi:hypothetical protein